jgi:hypothetical protein
MTSEAQGVALEADPGSKRIKLAYGALLLLVAGVCGALVPSYGFFPGMGALIFGVAAVSVIVGALVVKTGKAPCPSCGAELADVGYDAEAVPCEKCGAFAMTRAGRIHTTPVDHVAAQSVYPIALAPGQPYPPAAASLCVACGSPATTRGEREMTKTVVGAPGVGRIVKKWTISRPVCAAHSAPDANGNVGGVTSYEGRLSIRSHRAWRMATGRG